MYIIYIYKQGSVSTNTPVGWSEVISTGVVGDLLATDTAHHTRESARLVSFEYRMTYRFETLNSNGCFMCQFGGPLGVVRGFVFGLCHIPWWER